MDLQLSLKTLRYIVETADCGSVTEAARRLQVSQPSVSSALAQAERDLGVQIFVRHHARGMTLSVPGRRLVDEARPLLVHAAAFSKTARALGDPLSGQIVVGSFPTLAMRYMPRIIDGFARAFPKIEISLIEGDHHEILSALQDGGMEIAIGYDYALPPELHAHELAALPPHALLMPDHPLAGEKAVWLGDLAEDPFILLDLPHSRDYFAGLFAACGVEPNIAFRSRSPELVRGLVGNGRGFSLSNVLPAVPIAYDGSRIATIPLRDDLPPVRIMLLHLPGSGMRPAVAAFAGHLRAEFAGGGTSG
ncbi:DNA-binding transcriptional regulator, LysR family [Aureimonas altamirensis DSM 21988]|jgi:DNA-binding transcriptional LysR family regulator|uniref:DNA-binding transcriptional regulator, LysR family n=1 Tax=Aureimonas altamirensis DSM 21988 TaxID=1121026 RepID=A0ABY1IQP6_9HYPH|nr:LysR family transcriptional regulator [Aureimonas altamirensis]SHJ93511.1 DNA-binding transcriptional regulator, LysR family [Aureimonas altamirensis DSM 21988]